MGTGSGNEFRITALPEKQETRNGVREELRINAKRVEIERKGETLVLRPLPDENCWPDGYLESFAAGRLNDSFERAAQGESGVERRGDGPQQVAAEWV